MMVTVRSAGVPEMSTDGGKSSVTVGIAYEKNGASPDDKRLDTVTRTASSAPVCFGITQVSWVSEDHDGEPQV
jgi:hypothetical protein